MANHRRIVFAIHGIRVALTTDSDALIDSVTADFAYFKAADTGPADIEARAWNTEPRWSDAPSAKCVMIQPGCVVYEANGDRWVDYQGRGLCRWRYDEEAGDLWSADPDLLYEITYLLILSRLGELHDRQGIHRVHALGLAVEGKGVLCMLPSGGGKTTLGLRAIRRPGVMLLSDDTPLVRSDGVMLPFPTRMGCVGKPEGIPDEHLRLFVRRHHKPKWLIDLGAFEDKITGPVPVRALLIGARQLQGEPRIDPLTPLEATPELFRSLVVGFGLPQVVEYFLRTNLADVVAKAALTASRAWTSASLARNARAYRFTLGRDLDANDRVFQHFLQHELS